MRDLDIRITLKKTFLKKYYDDGHSRVVEELSVCYGDARVDLAVINGSLHGYEIKSELDTLSRLPGQMRAYSKTFDYLTLVTGGNHLNGVIPKVPEWCGILVASYHKKTNEIQLSTFRRAKKNRQTDQLSLAQLLWHSETVEALYSLGVTKGIKSKPKRVLWQILAETATKQELSAIVRSALKLRANWKSDL